MLCLQPSGSSNKITINITNKSQEVSPFPSGDQMAKADKHKTQTTQTTHKRSTTLEQPAKIFHWRAQTGFTARLPHPLSRCGPRHTDAWPTRKTHNPSMHHLPEHTNQDTKRRQSKIKDPTAHKSEHRSKTHSTGQPLWA